MRRAAAIACALGVIVARGGAALAQDVGEIATVEDNDMILATGSLLVGTRHLEKASCAFYRAHADRYDALFIFASSRLSALTRSQQGWAVKTAARGIGRDAWPQLSQSFCSPRLKHAVKMADIDSYPDDPDATYTGAPGVTFSGIEIMGHELGHYWLAAVRFKQGARYRCLLRGFIPSDMPMEGDCDGYSNSAFNQHWSFFFDSNSVMYGNRITDLGGGRFELSNPGPKYGPLDQYLMGLRDPSEVPPMFLIEGTAESLAESTAYPVPRGQTVIRMGSRLDFTVGDIIAAEGARVPPRDPCHWKAAFMLVYPAGSPPSAAQIAKVDAYRRRFELWYAAATDGRGSMDTTLAGTGEGTPSCPANGPPVDAGVPVPEAGVVTPDAGMDAGVVETADASSVDAAAGSVDARAAADAAEPDRTTTIGVGDGCDCSSAGAPGRGAGALALLVLAALVRRRR